MTEMPLQFEIEHPTRHYTYESASSSQSEEIASIGSLEVESVPRPVRAGLTDSSLLFLSAVGCTMGWTALLSNLVYYTETLGPNSFLILNLCTFAPLFPVALAQARWDGVFDRQYNGWISFSFRGHVGFFFTTLIILLLPSASSNLVCLSLLALVLGLGSAVLHGSLKQLASIVYLSCGRLSAAVTSGLQASAAFVLLVQLVCRKNEIARFYQGTAVLVFLCWVAFLVFMSRSPDVVHSLARRDESMRLLLREPLLGSIAEVSHPARDREVSSRDREVMVTVGSELSYKCLWKRTWPCCYSVAITVASSMSIASWFNRVHSANPMNESLPQVLFYTRLFGDLLGRPATLLLEGHLSPLCLGILSTLRLAFLPLFFVYAPSTSSHALPLSDALVIAGVACFAFSSGFIVTLCYQAAPMQLAENEKDSSAKQNSLINVCFSASVLVGLMGSFTLLWVGFT